MKIISWNTQWFKGLDEVVDVVRIVRVAREMADFDAICLQEVAVNYPMLTGGAPADQPAELARHLPGFQVFFAPAIDEFSPDGRMRQQFGNLIATRLPVRQLQQIALPYPNPACAPGEGGALPSMQRVLAVCTVQAPWGPLRLMTTHLEYYSLPMRHAQAVALRDWHLQACALAQQPPKAEAGTPYQPKPHTRDAVLCGDFNFERDSGEHGAVVAQMPANGFVNSWDVLHPGEPFPATFRIYDRTYGPEPVGCDFFFVSESLIPRVRRFAVDQATKASDHQPVLIELA